MGSAADFPAHSVAVRTLAFALVAGTLLTVASALPYLLPGATHPFLLERPWLSADALWRGALVLHVASGCFVLPAGLFLISRRAYARWPRLHRRLGQVWLVALIALMVPSGTWLACFAKGGWLVGSGFLLSGVFSAGAALYGVRLAMRRDLRGHRAWLLRAYAQLASAISFRIWHLALQLAAVPYELTYATSLWLSVLGNALLVELLLRRDPATRRFRHAQDRPALDRLALALPRRRQPRARAAG